MAGLCSVVCRRCAEITIVLCYFQLCSEDYHWWCGGPSLPPAPQQRCRCIDSKRHLVSRAPLSWQPQNPISYTCSAETGGNLTLGIPAHSSRANSLADALAASWMALSGWRILIQTLRSRAAAHHATGCWLLPRRWRAYFTSGSSALYLFLYSDPPPSRPLCPPLATRLCAHRRDAAACVPPLVRYQAYVPHGAVCCFQRV